MTRLSHLPFALPCAAYRLTFQLNASTKPPSMASAMWRSVLGRALKIMQRTSIEADIALDAYDLFFGLEGNVRPMIMRTPVMRRRLVIEAGETIDVEFVLVGSCNELAPLLARALALAGEVGLGEARAEASLIQALWRHPQSGWQSFNPLQTVALAGCPSTPHMPDEPPAIVRLAMITPMDIKRFNRSLSVHEVDAPTMIRRLVKRACSLAEIDDPSCADIDLAPVYQACDRVVELARDLRPASHFRASANSTLRSLRGVTGQMILDLRDAPEIWPWLILAPWIHIGHKAAMGMGQATLEIASNDPPKGSREQDIPHKKNASHA